MFCKRWKLMLVIFLLTMLAAVAFALLRPTSYVYTSFYAIAETSNEKGELVGLEAPDVLVAQLNDRILPDRTRRYLNSRSNQQDWDVLPFTIETQHLEGTHLVSLTTHAREHQADHIEALHRQALEALAEQQATFVERRRAGLERRLAVVQKAVNLAGVDIGTHPKILGDIAMELTVMKAGEIKQIALRSDQAGKAGTPAILAMAAILALLLAVMGAAACQMVLAVRQRLAQN